MESFPAPPAAPAALQACPICAAVVDVGDHEPLETVSCPGCGASLTVRGTIDQFELLEVAGRGGMGVVFKARDTALDRLVALKLLRRDHSDNASLIRQLENEAAITASINHPFVVQVYSTGREGGRFYLAMELVSRGSLDDLIRAHGRVPEARALELASQIAQGLRAAHQHGLIHRDVKPGNILFADEHTAKIVDFGLAIFMAQEESVRGEIWGTPYYVAPEKLDNKPEDFRSDIYSLGATLFHALAGRPPFEAENASMVALKHLKSQPVSLQAFAPHVSGPTAYVINRTLLKNPGERYQSYDDFIEHLEYARTELAAAAGTPQEARRVVMESEENQKVWGWLTAAMVTIILLVSLLALIFRQQLFPSAAAPTPAPVAVEPVVTTSPFQAAHDLLAQGQPAAEAFRQIAAQPNLRPADVQWARLQEGLAEWVAGHPVEGRAVFQELTKAGMYSSAADDSQCAKFFLETAQKMAAGAPVPETTVKALDRTNCEAFALLLYGVNNWQLGQTKEAVELFRQFRNVKLTGADAWIAGLKPIASRYVDEFTAFQMKADQLKAAASPNERVAAAAELSKFTGPLAARAAELATGYQAEFAALEKRRSALPEEGIYQVVNRKSGRSLDVDNLSLADGGRIHQWDFVNGGNQQWHFKPLSGGVYQITAVHSGKAMTVDSSGPEEGAPIQQWENKGRPEQRWLMQSVGGGYFTMRSKKSEKVLTASGLNAGAGMIQTNDAGVPEQQWSFSLLARIIGEWTAGDIGRAEPAGGSSRDAASGVWKLKSAGADLWTNQDSCHFVHQRVDGDFELVARGVSLERADEWTKAGLMLRTSVAPDSPNVFVGITPAERVIQQCRSVANAETVTTGSIEKTAAPRWLKLIRTRDSVKGFHSSDGKEWVPLATDTLVDLPKSVFIGLAATSHVERQVATAVLDKVELKKK